MLNMLVQEEMKFKMELCEQQMEEVRGRREVEITYIKIIKSLNISMISGRDYPAGRKAAGCPPSPFHHSSGVHCTQQFELESDSFRTNMKVVLRGLLRSSGVDFCLVCKHKRAN